MLLACAIFYYRGAQWENDAPAFLWAALSVLVSVVTWLVLSWGLLGCLGGQVVLFAVMTVVKCSGGHHRDNGDPRTSANWIRSVARGG